MTARLFALLISILLVVPAARPQGAAPPISSRAPGFVSLSPAVLDFGPQLVGKSGTALVSTLSNQGKAPVAVTDVTASGIDFSETDGCQGTLSPGASCQISVTFMPAIDGERMGAVIISDSDPGSPHMLVLKGSGTQ